MIDFRQPTVPPQELGLASDVNANLKALMQEQIAHGEIAGGVMLLARHGKVVHFEAQGVRDLETGAPMERDTIFSIYSMTKPITATAMMILFDQRKWSPSDPVTRFLPELANMKVFAAHDAEGRILIEEPRHIPTIGEILSHTGGFAYGLGLDRDDVVDRLYQEARLLSAVTSDEMVKRLASLPLAYQPGTRWLYSISSDLAGVLIERLSGKSLPDFFDESIFAPLGMTDTGFAVPPEKSGRIATSYTKKHGNLVAMSPLFSPNRPAPFFASAGAGLFSTVPDYARFADLLLGLGRVRHGGRRIASEAAIAMQMENHLSAMILRRNDGVGHYRFAPGFGYGFGGAVCFGPREADQPVGRDTYQWDGAFGTWFWIDPEHDLLFVGMIQRGPSNFLPLQRGTQEIVKKAIRTR